MEKDQESPFPREPWQRLLQDRRDAPPETTDARIRARARKAVAPRAAHWVLPASLAASFLLAVLIVQSQYGKQERPTVATEADLAAPAAMEAPAANTGSARAERKESAPAIAAFEREPAEFAPEPEARVGGPEQDLKASSEMESVETDQDESELEETAQDVPLAEIEPDSQKAPQPTTAITADAERTRASGALMSGPAAKQRTPEAWYAEIEALRKAGRIEEADRELARFETTYPAWLKEHDLPKP